MAGTAHRQLLGARSCLPWLGSGPDWVVKGGGQHSSTTSLPEGFLPCKCSCLYKHLAVCALFTVPVTAGDSGKQGLCSPLQVLLAARDLCMRGRGMGTRLRKLAPSVMGACGGGFGHGQAQAAALEMPDGGEESVREGQVGSRILQRSFLFQDSTLHQSRTARNALQAGASVVMPQVLQVRPLFSPGKMS